jgi:hypothetical protein
MTDMRADHHLELLIASACRVLAASEDLGAITIVVNRRLTYEELMRTRDRATPCRVAIAKDGAWTFRVRRRGATRQPPSVGRCRGEDEHGSGDSGAHGAH